MFHALYYIATEGSPRHIPAKFRRPRDVRSAQLRLDAGTLGCKDNDWLREGMESLGESCLFEALTLSDNGRVVAFKPSKRLGDPSQRDDRFAPLETRHIAECRTIYDFLLYTRAAEAHGRDHPRFFLARIDKGPLWAGPGRRVATAGWLRPRRSAAC